MDKDFDFFEPIKYGFKVVLENFGKVLFLWLILATLSFLSGFIGGLLPVPVLMQIVEYLVGSLITVGLLKITLDVYDGKELLLESIFKEYKYLKNFILASLIVTVMGALFMVALVLITMVIHTVIQLFVDIDYKVVFSFITLFAIVPLAIFFIRAQFVGFFVVDKNESPVQAFNATLDITKGRVLKLFLFNLLIGALQIMGALCILLGLLITIPVGMVAMTYVYRKISA